MNTIHARYEVGVEGESQEHFRLWCDASMRASAIGGYVYDRMARIGKPQLWQAVNGDLIVQAVCGEVLSTLKAAEQSVHPTVATVAAQEVKLDARNSG